ncbi:hypothetical protein L1F30_09230 [Simiduia sp. 21SJ11W-1]|uniref:tetratricopeptide repeat protein n=1 Tax=Simiduia sp. 21SJ11W-1 TaxID=2909669 RepID=UPI00209EAB79|nr:hypothetical protein [Simiduia sp. 21SJ11W-1]UTA46358.1 hypothetical protein L1F30_09230 [Simiduia sp. 21SJ11W-1]
MSDTPPDTAELSTALLARIKSLCAKGYQHYDNAEFDQALRTFYQAWVQLPKPQTQYQAAGWVLTALGDCYFKLGKWSQALEALNSAQFCPEGRNNLFALMRKGQVQLEQGELASARITLFNVYSQGGQDMLAKEPARYLAAINDLTQPA